MRETPSEYYQGSAERYALARISVKEDPVNRISMTVLSFDDGTRAVVHNFRDGGFGLMMPDGSYRTFDLDEIEELYEAACASESAGER